MVILISGASHTGKTMLAQRMLEKYGFPYLSIDHLKMGLIRSGNTQLTPMSDDEALTAYLWPILREIIKTVIENKQDLIIEGCYIPFDYEKDFEETYLSQIRYICLILSERYIKSHFGDIKKYACVIENRLDDSGCTMDALLLENQKSLEMCRKHGAKFVLIDNEYEIELSI